MNTTLNISIPFPCHENWDAMTPKEQGKHCTDCDKVIVDFTNMSDDEILQFIQSKKTSILERVKNSQLNNNPTFNKKLKLFLYAFVFLLSINAEAQTIDSIPKGNENAIVQSDSTQEYIIEGIVIDENGFPMDFATVEIKTNKKIFKKVKTDMNGKFKFQIYKSGEYSFLVSFPGYTVSEWIENIKLQTEINKLNFNFTKDKKLQSNHVIIHKHVKYPLILPGQPRKIVTREDMIHMGYR